jgi:hypothetical protein
MLILKQDMKTEIIMITLTLYCVFIFNSIFSAARGLIINAHSQLFDFFA